MEEEEEEQEPPASAQDQEFADFDRSWCTEGTVVSLADMCVSAWIKYLLQEMIYTSPNHSTLRKCKETNCCLTPRLRDWGQRRYSEELASLTRTVISNEAIRRLMRRAGVTRWSDAVHKHVRVLLLDYLCDLVCKSLIYANHSRIGEITSEFIQQAVQLQPGRRLYVDSKRSKRDLSRDITQDSKALVCDRVHLKVQKYGAQYKPGWAAITEVERFQESKDLLLRSRPLKHLIDHLERVFVGCICDSSARHYFIRFKPCAVRALHETVQDYIVHLMGDALFMAMHAKHTLLYPRDIMLIRRICCCVDKKPRIGVC